MKLQNIIIKYLMSWSPHDGGKHGPRRIVTGETGFAHAGPIVDNESSNVFVAHDENWGSVGSKKKDGVERQLFSRRKPDVQ